MNKQILAISLWLFTNAVFATDYYVSPAGVDNASVSGSIATPFKTLTYALSRYVSGSGSTIFLRAGIYAEEILINKSGNATSNLVITRYQTEVPVFDGTSFYITNGLIEVWNSQYVTISGLQIQNLKTGVEPIGIYINNAQHIIIENNYIRNVYSSGIQAWGVAAGAITSDITIRNNEIVDTNDGGPNEHISVAGVNGFSVYNNDIHESGTQTIDYSGGGEGIDLKQGSRNGLVYGNYVHDNYKTGIYVDAWDQHTYNIEIYKNFVENIGKGGIAIASEQAGEVENIIIHNNVIIANGLVASSSGIVIYSFASGGVPANLHPIHNISVLNNTISGNYNGMMLSDDFTGIKNFENILIQNNLFDGKTGSYNLGSKNILTTATPAPIYKPPYSSTDFTITDNAFRPLDGNGWNPYFPLKGINIESIPGTTPSLITSVTAAGNLVMNNTTFIQDKGTGTASSIKTFINNFSDNGIVIPPTEKATFLNNFVTHFAQDFNGNNRFNGTAIDIGAFEVSTTNFADNILANKEEIKLFPNPSQSGILSIEIPESLIKKDIHLKVYTSIGQLVDDLKLIGEKEMSYVIKNKGIYFIVIESESNSYSSIISIY